MRISMICVTNQDRAIGYKNKLLWDIPDDLKHFKEITEGHVVIMGDKTFDSLGKPLSKRINVVVTNNQDFKADGVVIVRSIEEALEKAKELEKNGEIFIIGGGSIYQQMIKYVDKLYLTIIDDQPANVDTYFPDYSEFKNEISSEEHEYNGLKYKFIELVKE